MNYMLAICTALISSTSARAERPLIATPSAIKNLRIAMPMPLETGMQRDLMGIDLEDASIRQKLMKDAAEYLDLRHGKFTHAQVYAWLARCTGLETATASALPEANSYCEYELERRLNTGGHSLPKHPENNALAKQIEVGNFGKISEKSLGELISAVRNLDRRGKIGSVTERISLLKECVPSPLASALGYKLEEKFPDPDAIEKAQLLYQKASKCGNDLAAAQASFRLGLIKIWQHQCHEGAEVASLMRKVESIPEASNFHARAIYWRYYCASQQGNESEQRQAQDQLFREHPMSFQSLEANGEDDTRVNQLLANKDPQISLRSIVRPELNGFIRAVEALIRKDAPALAAEMLDHRVHDFTSVEPEVRVYLAVILNRAGYSLPKFKLLSELFQDVPSTVSPGSLKLFFPLSYYELILGKKDKVDPLLILSLIRQESAFNKEARSRAGARGLMQVMPQTARMVASVRSTARLLDPATNIGVGTKYFAKRLESYGGDVELTLAAYNAGFGRVEDWKRRYPTENRILFLDLIPFRETRDYVSSILRNYYWYVKLYLSPEISSPDAALQTATDPVDLESGDAAVTNPTKLPMSTVRTVRTVRTVSKVQAIISAHSGATQATSPVAKSEILR